MSACVKVRESERKRAKKSVCVRLSEATGREVCVCVCVRKIERERQRQREAREREREREKEEERE